MITLSCPSRPVALWLCLPLSVPNFHGEFFSSLPLKANLMDFFFFTKMLRVCVFVCVFVCVRTCKQIGQGIAVGSES